MNLASSHFLEFTSSNGSLEVSLGFSRYSIMSPAKSDRFLPQQSGILLFLLLVGLLRLGLVILPWIKVVKVNIVLLFSVFHHWVWCPCVFVTHAFIMLGYFFFFFEFFLSLPDQLTWSVGIAVLHLLRYSPYCYPSFC